MKSAKSIGLTGYIKSHKQVTEHTNQAQEKRKESIKDKIDINELQTKELTSFLTPIIKDIKNKADLITDPLRLSFYKKGATGLTQETSTSLGEYITNIVVDDKAHTGDVKIAVERSAGAASMLLSAALNTGFDKVAALGKTGNITLTVSGNARVVPIVPADTVTKLVQNINNVFRTNSDQFEAFPIGADANTSFIQIRAKNTGNGNITVAYDVGGIPGPLTGGDLYTQNSTAGLDAKIYVNGAPVTGSSNKFSDIIEGLSFEVTGKINTANPSNGALYNNLNYNIIKIADDHSGIKEATLDFFNTRDNLAFYYAKHSQDKSSPLYSSPLMKEIGSFLTMSSEAISDYSALGIGFEKKIKDGIEYDALCFKDASRGQKFQEQFDNNFDSVCKFLVSNAKVTPAPGNLSKLQYIPRPSDEGIVPRSILGRDINVAIDFTDPTQPRIIATIDSITLAAKVTKSTGGFSVVFGKESALSGISFYLAGNGAAGTENYTINYTSGLANRVRKCMDNILSDNGKEGTIALINEKITKSKESYLKEMQKIDETMKKSNDKLNKAMHTAEFAEMRHRNFMSLMEAINPEK